jgi:putative ABC transport system permease protein
VYDNHVDYLNIPVRISYRRRFFDKRGSKIPPYVQELHNHCDQDPLRHKVFSLINISGLAIGLASAILILLYVQDELSYDRFHEDHERIFRVGLEATNQGNDIRVAVSAVPLAPVLSSAYPEVEASTRLFTFVGESIVKHGESIFIEEQFYYADEGFFRVFNQEMLSGEAERALTLTNTVVITEEMAEKYFGPEDPMGKIIEVSVESYMDPFARRQFEVTGVVRKFPDNSHLGFDFIGSLKSTGLTESSDWLDCPVYTYLKLREGASGTGIFSNPSGIFT